MMRLAHAHAPEAGANGANNQALPSAATASDRPLHDLTFYQSRFWDMEKAFPGTSGYVLPGILTSREFTDGALLEAAVLGVIRCNDATRLRFVETAGRPRQYVSDVVEGIVSTVDLSHDPQALAQWLDQQAPKPFPVQDSNVFFAVIVKTTPTEYGVFFKGHHIVADERTAQLLVRQIYGNYIKLCRGEDLADQAQHSYIDYVRSEQEYMRSERFLKNRAYWESKFDDLPESHFAEFQTTSPAAEKEAGLQIHHLDLIQGESPLGPDDAALLGRALAAFARYFQTVKNHQDVIFGLPIHNRVNHREKNTMGMFANSALLRITTSRLADEDSVLQTTQKELRGLLRNQRYPYPLLKQYIEQKYGIDGHPYQTYVSFLQVRNEPYGVRFFINHTQYCPLIIRIYHDADRNSLAFHFHHWKADYCAEDIAQIFGFVRAQFAGLASEKVGAP